MIINAPGIPSAGALFERVEVIADSRANECVHGDGRGTLELAILARHLVTGGNVEMGRMLGEDLNHTLLVIWIAVGV